MQPRSNAATASVLRRALVPVLLGIAAFAAIAAALWGLALLVSRPGATTENRLGDEEFVVGRADRLARAIETGGAPLLFQDLLVGGERDIFVNHTGTDPVQGWVAFAARVEGADRSCTLVWVAADRVLRDPCTSATYPPDGSGLIAYPTRVSDGGDVVVDLRTPAQGSPTSS